jgi:hypothetical protein
MVLIKLVIFVPNLGLFRKIILVPCIRTVVNVNEEIYVSGRLRSRGSTLHILLITSKFVTTTIRHSRKFATNREVDSFDRINIPECFWRCAFEHLETYDVCKEKTVMERRAESCRFLLM